MQLTTKDTVEPPLTATSPQRQRPLKRAPSAKVTSPQRPVNQRLTNGVYETPIFFVVKAKVTKIDSHRSSLVSVSVWFLIHQYILIVLHIYMLQ